MFAEKKSRALCAKWVLPTKNFQKNPLNNFYDSERIPLICVHESAPQVDALSEDVGKEYAIFSKRRSKKD